MREFLKAIHDYPYEAGCVAIVLVILAGIIAEAVIEKK